MSETDKNAQGQKPKTSKLAIAALVLGFIFWCLLGLVLFDLIGLCLSVFTGIIGLILGNSVKRKIKERGGGKWLARLRFAISMVIIAAGGLLIVFSLTYGLRWGHSTHSTHSTPSETYRMICATNLSGLWYEMLIYAYDFDDQYPTADKWCDLLIEYTDVTEKQFRCPGNREERCSYAINPNASAVTHPDMVVLFETKDGWNQFGGPELLTTENHKGEGCNILFNDGHIEFVKPEQLGELKWKAEEGKTIE